MDHDGSGSTMSEMICVFWPGTEDELHIGASIVLSEPESHHLIRVRRCGENEQVWAITGKGPACRCTITGADPSSAQLVIEEIADMWREPARRVTLYQALIRPGMMDLIVEQGTELGITRLVPLLTERVERGGAKIDRWRRVAEESAKQCGRGWIPEISATMEWNDFLEQKMANPLIVAHDKTEQSLYEVIHEGRLIPNSGDIGVIVGPEGGLSGNELDDLRKLGSIEVNLGVRRLRSETSALVILAQLSGC